MDAAEFEKTPEWMKSYKKPSNFTPPKNRETNLDTFLDLVGGDTMDLLKINSDQDWHNLDENQKKSLDALRKNRNITIKL